MVSQVEQPSAPDANAPTSTTTRLVRFARTNAQQIGIFVVLLLIWGTFIAQAPDTFLSRNIYISFMTTVPFFGIMALPLTMLVIAGDIDLSFGSIMAVGVGTFAGIFNMTENPWLAFAGCLSAGFLAGLANGLLVVRVGIPSLIATIGTDFFWRGVVLVVRDGDSAVLSAAKNTALGQILVGRVFGVIPGQMIWFVVVAVLVWLLLNRHRFGAHTYLIGDNVNSANLMGINVDRTRVLLFAMVGTCAALAGILASLHVSNFFTTLGEGQLLPTLGSVFLGGTSVFGGSGTVIGTFIATFIIGSINGGIVAIGLTGFWTELIYGLIIIASVAMHTLLRRRLG